MNVKLLIINTPNKNGRIYTKECIENALSKLERNEIFIRSNISDLTPNLSDVIGVGKNLRIENECLVADCDFFESVKQFEGSMINVRPMGFGTVNESGIVQDDYRIVGLTIVQKPQSIS